MLCREAARRVVYSHGNEVYIHSVERRGGWLVAMCYVRSESRRDECYQVVLKLRPGTRYFTGHCDCPDFKYRGGPCKHIVKAKVALREYLKIAKRVE
ncbi:MULTISPECIES: SWIM zinc finger family protein [Pyrobaculum]|uniref:Zinc finger, SWIM domain protein n=2 Tax=Pyrobaculum arsenaticum TaxID=121277 RepID=A4WHN5_PYRAR|nr:SWIM zinc finger family protein [Pyrobaculum arsenaticum]ABP49902.1 zinc finger, SWIM domain protein [Pyrobaculum arsenaticum DSM 13514]NYR15887.1 SWIM zinc finger family protein [Pyrobaculum arsenaticum]